MSKAAREKLYSQEVQNKSYNRREDNVHRRLLVTGANAVKGRILEEEPALLYAKSAMHATTGSASVIPAFFPAQHPKMRNFTGPSRSKEPPGHGTKELARGCYATFGGGDADDGEAEAVAEEVGLGLRRLVALGLAADVAGKRRVGVGVVGEGLHVHIHVHGPSGGATTRSSNGAAAAAGRSNLRICQITMFPLGFFLVVFGPCSRLRAFWA